MTIVKEMERRVKAVDDWKKNVEGKQIRRKEYGTGGDAFATNESEDQVKKQGC